MKNETKKASGKNKGSPIKLFIGGKNILEDKENIEDMVRARFAEAIQVQNLCFLIGSGCSKQLGIAMMSDFAKDANAKFLKSDKYHKLVESYYSDGKNSTLVENNRGKDVEPFLGYLHRFKSVFNRQESLTISLGDEEFKLSEVNEIIEGIKEIIIQGCNKLDNNKLENHKLFIKKILARDTNQSLERVKIFTTNYDLAFEYSLDSLGVYYFNGFVGTINRRFDPAVFEIDVHYRKADRGKVERHQKVLDLVKLHGSINWAADKIDANNIYGIKELSNFDGDSEPIMIYPTPLKVDESLGMPYAELFRYFYSSIAREETVLIVMGYSFSDDHINKIITQALTIPSFRVIVIGDENLEIAGEKISKLKDPRIWHFCDDAEADKQHYFGNFVRNFLPNVDEEKISRIISETLNKLSKDEKQ
jgi:hypothetical protein